MQIPLYIADAFASRAFTGNPAAVCPLDAWIDDSLMQAIAAQNNLAETAFLIARGDADYEIRWFTPRKEVPLCGHATLASAFVLRTELGTNAATIRFASKSGPLAVQCSDDAYTLDFPARPPRRASMPSWFVSAFGANPSELYEGEYRLAVFPSQEILAALEPDFSLMKRYADSSTICTAPGDAHDFVSRFFAPAFGIDEDPVTGAAHTTLIPYWAKRLRKAQLTARQISARGGELRCALEGERVAISGAARLYSRGSIVL